MSFIKSHGFLQVVIKNKYHATSDTPNSVGVCSIPKGLDSLLLINLFPTVPSRRIGFHFLSCFHHESPTNCVQWISHIL